MSASRRVTMITTSYPTAESPFRGPFVADLAERVAARGWSVRVAALVPPGEAPEARAGVEAAGVDSPFWRDDGRDHVAGIPTLLRREPLRALGAPRALTALRAAARAFGPTDVVHAHWLPTRLSAAGLGAPVVTTAHGADVRLAERLPGVARLLAGPGPVLVGTAELEARLRRCAPRARLVRLPPVGLDPLAAAADAPVPLRVLAIMRLAPEKGVDALAAAWSAVRRELPAARLVVIGDGPLRPRLEAPGVELLGNIPPSQVPREIARASLFVQSSEHEPFGVATMEALSQGRPVVATATGIAAELVTPAVGRLVPVGDDAAMARAIADLLPQADALATMGRAAAHLVAARLGWEPVLDRLLAVYGDAIRSGRGSGA